MIPLTRLDGSRLAINHRQVERVDAGPATVVTLMNGNRYIVAEDIETIIDLAAAFEARVSGHTKPARTRNRKPVRGTPHLKLANDATAGEEG